MPEPPEAVTHHGFQRPVRLEFVQKAFILHDGCLLMVRKSGSDPRNPHLWEVPGGRLNLGEDTDAHVRREVWEETGVQITPGPPFQLWEWTMPDTRASEVSKAPDGGAESPPVQMVAVGRICTPLSTELTTAHRTPGDHLDEACWVPVGTIDGYDIIPDLKPVLQDFLRHHVDGG